MQSSKRNAFHFSKKYWYQNHAKTQPLSSFVARRPYPIFTCTHTMDVIQRQHSGKRTTSVNFLLVKRCQRPSPLFNKTPRDYIHGGITPVHDNEPPPPNFSVVFLQFLLHEAPPAVLPVLSSANETKKDKTPQKHKRAPLSRFSRRRRKFLKKKHPTYLLLALLLFPKKQYRSLRHRAGPRFSDRGRESDTGTPGDKKKQQKRDPTRSFFYRCCSCRQKTAQAP